MIPLEEEEQPTDPDDEEELSEDDLADILVEGGRGGFISDEE